jgi:aminoglycoside phosphotransferase (APT) family kinase protein
VADPGPLVGSGRDADVYDVGPGRVLRRPRVAGREHLVAREAVVLRHLHDHGYPVAEVFDVDGSDMVMQRLEGVTMLTALERAPWRLGRHAATWAELMTRLATVPVDGLAGADLPVRFGEPTSLLHLDFHPDNIMLTPDGPVVFDWTNVSLGPAAADVAQSWLISATSSVDGNVLVAATVRLVRRRLVDRFLAEAGRPAAAAVLPLVAEYRLADRNVRPEEAERIRALVASGASGRG